jgi:hypothetical protein
MRQVSRVVSVVMLVLALGAAVAWATGVKALPAKSGVQLGDPLKFFCHLDGFAASAVKSYAWDFGDGGTSNEQNPEYTFKDEGTYSVTVTVTLADGKKYSDTTTVQAQKECQC